MIHTHSGAPSTAPRHRLPGFPGIPAADLEGGREPRHRVRARLRAYRARFTSIREGR